MLLIFDYFLSTTGLLRTSAVLRENNFSKGGRIIESFGPVADHFLNSSLSIFFQILYHLLWHPFFISNSCTLIKHHFILNLDLDGVIVILVVYWILIFLVLLLIFLLVQLCYCCWFHFHFLLSSQFIIISNYIYHHYYTQFISFKFQIFSSTFSFIYFISLHNFTTSILFIILCCVFSYLMIFLDYIIISIPIELCFNDNWN